MFNLDDSFLDSVGLTAMPEEQRTVFLQHVYEQLEKQVGAKLSEGMSDAQLDQFASIIDRSDDVIVSWLAQYAPDYQQDPIFQRIADAAKLPLDSIELRAEFAATKWLEVNRPDYRDVVAQTLEELKQEIAANRDAILGNAPAA